MKEARKLAVPIFELTLVHTKSARDTEDFEMIRHWGSRFRLYLGDQTEKDSPQPQAFLTFGFSSLKPDSNRPW